MMGTTTPGGVMTYFIGGEKGPWQIQEIKPLRGDSVLTAVTSLTIADQPLEGAWTLRGVQRVVLDSWV